MQKIAPYRTNNSAVYNSEKGVVDETEYKQTQSPRNQDEQRGDKGTVEDNSESGSHSRKSENFSNIQGVNQREQQKEGVERRTTETPIRQPEQLKLDFSKATPDEIVEVL